MTATITWYIRLAGWWLGIASITLIIVSGSGRARTSTLRRTRPPCVVSVHSRKL